MKHILLIGAGRSTKALIQYLLNYSTKEDWKIIVADYYEDLAKESVAGYKNAEGIFFDVNNTTQREANIAASDIVISMLPPKMHYLIVKDCLSFRKNLITASYTPGNIKELDKKARKENILILNEIGLDPGLDHMSAMRIINEIKVKNGKLLSFKSFCGGLVHPDYDNNPWNYKFTWNPRNVVLAGFGNAEYIEKGEYISVPYNKLFRSTKDISVLDLGFFEAYPNRDSLSYRSTYGLEDIPTFLRGTIRKKGFCKAWDFFVQLGMTNDSLVIQNSKNITYSEYIELFLKKDVNLSVENRFCKYFNISKDSHEFQKVYWLGLFSDKIVNLEGATSAQILQKILEEKWKLDPEDKDMILMQHEFKYILNGKKQTLNSSLVVYGENTEDTAMAKTVGLPVAIATKLILKNQLKLIGAHIPTIPEIYEPILNELEDFNISFIEEIN